MIQTGKILWTRRQKCNIKFSFFKSWVEPLANFLLRCEGSVKLQYILYDMHIVTWMGWLKHGFGLVNQFIGSSLYVTTFSSYTLKITVIIAHVTSHTKSSNSSSGHTAILFELRNLSETNFHSRILSYSLGTVHAQETQFFCCVLQTTQKTSHVITISLVHWRADCCPTTSYKHSSLYMRVRNEGSLSSRCLSARWYVTIYYVHLYRTTSIVGI
jgi:hypothetical protein